MDGMNRIIDRNVKQMEEMDNTIKMQEARLKAVAMHIQNSNMAQPERCVFGVGICGYPIDDCYNCPLQPWNFDPYLGMTKCKIGGR